MLTKILYEITVKHIEPYYITNINAPLLEDSDIKDIKEINN